MIRLAVVLIVTSLTAMSLTVMSLAVRAETCRFTGTTSQDGRLAVRADAAQLDGLLTLDVTVEFAIHAWMTDYRYLGQEITTWSVGEGRRPALRSVAVNQRSLADGSIKRQQWDVFTRNGARLEGYRVQAKSLADFQQRHPAFVPHWSPAGFGRPWLADFPRAGAERRPDLDLPAGPASDAQTPLAFAFYWTRFLPPGGGAFSLVLPGFKRDKQVPLSFGPATPPATPDEGGGRWSTPLRHPALDASSASLATAWVSPDRHLLQLGFDIHTAWASGTATLRTQGCQGLQTSPGQPP